MPNLDLGVPVDPLAAIAQLFQKRPDRGELLVEVRVIPLDRDVVRRGPAGDQVAFALLPVPHMGLRQLSGGIVQQRQLDDVRFDPQHLGGNFRKLPGNRLEDLPVRLALIGGVHRRLKRMDERVHVGRVQIVLFVPAGRRQHDVGIDAGGRHPEIDRHQQVQFALGRLVMPDRLDRLHAALLAQILAHHAVIGAQQMLEEILVPLAAGSQQVGAPDEQVAGPVLRGIRILAGHLQGAGRELLGHIGRYRLARGLGRLRHLQRVRLQLRRRGQPAHAFGPDVVVDQADVPIALRGRGRQDLARAQGLIAPLVGMRIPGAGRVHVPGRAAPVQCEGQGLPAGLRAQLLLTDIMRPAAPLLTDAAAHHQHVDDAAIGHVHVVPVVQAGPQDDHRFAFGLFGVRCEFAGHGDDLLAGDPGDLFRPCRRIGAVVVVILRHPGTTQSPVQAVIGAEEVEDRGDQHR